MEKQRLLQTIETLRAEVAQTESVDPETLAALEAAMSDLQRELDRRGAKVPADSPPVSGLKDALLKFESEYPQLSTAVGKVADALAAMGI
jgi:Domain of unknown function (DUF4404)